MIAGFLWFQGTFLQFGTIQVLGKENIQPDFLEVRLAEGEVGRTSFACTLLHMNCLTFGIRLYNDSG